MVELNYGFYFWLFGAVIFAQLAYDFLCMIGENFGSFLDFTKTYKDLGFKYLSFVFRRGKHIRFPKDFPSDLREACLGKNSYYLENEDDLKKGNEARRQAKSLVRAVLTNDELINEYLKGQYFTYEDFLSLKETIGLADVQEQRNIIAYLKGKLKYMNAAETIHEIIVAEMTNRDLDIPVGKRQAALYYALSMEGCVDNWTQKEFVDFIKMLSMVNPEVKGVNSPTMSHHLNSVAVKQDSKYIRAKIKKVIAPYIAES